MTAQDIERKFEEAIARLGPMEPAERERIIEYAMKMKIRIVGRIAHVERMRADSEQFHTKRLAASSAEREASRASVEAMSRARQEQAELIDSICGCWRRGNS